MTDTVALRLMPVRRKEPEGRVQTRAGAAPVQEGVTQESGCGRRRFTAEETGPTPAQTAKFTPVSSPARARQGTGAPKYGTAHQPCRYRIGIDGDCRCRPQAASTCAPVAGRRSSFAAVATAARFIATATARRPHVKPACAWPVSAISAVATAVWRMPNGCAAIAAARIK